MRSASRGWASLAPALSTRVMDRFAVLAQREVDPGSLTERELEILSYMGKGLTYKEIGAQLAITDKTVNYHVMHILRKLNVRIRAEAVVVAMERGLLNRL